MANINDAYDPTYSGDPSYSWDPATSQWFRKDSGTPTDANGKSVQMQPDGGRFRVDPNVASTGAEGANWMGQLQGMQTKLGERKAPQLDQTQSNQMRDAQTGSHSLRKRQRSEIVALGFDHQPHRCPLLCVQDAALN